MRKENAPCVARTSAGFEGEAWCGRRLDACEWHFVDASHAAENGLAGGRLQICPDCANAISAAVCGYEGRASGAELQRVAEGES